MLLKYHLPDREFPEQINRDQVHPEAHQVALQCLIQMEMELQIHNPLQLLLNGTKQKKLMKSGDSGWKNGEDSEMLGRTTKSN